MTTDEMLKAAKDRLAVVKAEAAKLEAAILALEGKAPVPAKVEPAPQPQPFAWPLPFGYGCRCALCLPAKPLEH